MSMDGRKTFGYHSSVSDDPKHLWSRRGELRVDSWAEAQRGVIPPESLSGGQKEVRHPLSWAWHPRGWAYLSPGVTELCPPNCPSLEIEIRTNRNASGL